ncbi:hypothetical protein [Muricauda sp. MAR_2010_75]|uniref:hypothetical protein n=1 Tax=Allomuricauda sp. MAR_2010_75 TaxID=1250232 RepID=UPI0012E0BFEB|nr:hypothetical protein [Muricauda sp. MAR_2010_75]
MKSVFYFIGCAFMVCASALAQDQNLPIVEQPINSITFDLLSPFYPRRLLSSGPNSSHLTRWRLGYRHQLNQRWAIGADFGYGNESLAVFMERKDYRLYEFRPELLYLVLQKSKTRVYFSFQPFYILHTETLLNNSVLAEDIGSVSFDQADYKRIKYGFTLNYGFLFPISSIMGLNVYTGGGLKRRENQYKSFVNPTPIPYHEDHFPPYYDSYFPLTEFEFSFGIKVYFLIQKRNQT